MNLNDIKFLYRYNDWANDRTLNAAAALTSEQFNQKHGSSFSSVRDTMVHIFGAEWVWLERWNGTSPRALPGADDIATIDNLRSRWNGVEAARKQFLAGLSDESLKQPITYTNFKGQEWSYSLESMLQHLVNHSSYHRGQVTTMLRQLGAEATSTDLLLYLDATIDSAGN